MTGSLSCRVEQLSSTTPAVVYDVLMDIERWSDWMPTVSAASWERRRARHRTGWYQASTHRDQRHTRPGHRWNATASSRLRLIASALLAPQGLPGRRPHRRASERVPHHMDGNLRIAYSWPRKTTSGQGPFNVCATSGGAGARSGASGAITAATCARRAYELGGTLAALLMMTKGHRHAWSRRTRNRRRTAGRRGAARAGGRPNQGPGFPGHDQAGPGTDERVAP